MSDQVFAAKCPLDPTMSLGELEVLKSELREIEGLGLRISKMVLDLSLTDPETLKYAPSGSHEFARGFLLFSRMLTIRCKLGNKNLWWDECEVKDGELRPTGRRVKVDHAGHAMTTNKRSD